MWFCFFPPLSKAAQECYCYSFSSSKESGKQNPLMHVDKKEGTMNVLLLKVPPQSWSRNKAEKETTPQKPLGPFRAGDKAVSSAGSCS